MSENVDPNNYYERQGVITIASTRIFVKGEDLFHEMLQKYKFKK